MKILLIGPQGCGKGTQGDLLGFYLKIPVLASGQLLREVKEDDPNYSVIKEHMNQGILVPQNIVAELLRSETSQEKYNQGFVLDGWGRSLKDLEYFDPGFDYVINIVIAESTTIQRLSSRMTCSSCGAIFNTISVPPKVPGICDTCGGKLFQREDDTEQAIRKRLEIYHSETKDVLMYFKKKGNLIEINGEGSPHQVFEEIKKTLKI